MSSRRADGTQVVVIGAAGTATGFGVARTLRAHWPNEVTLVAADVNPRQLVATAALSDGYVQSPPVADPSYGDWLTRTLKETAADVYIPLLDQDIALAAELAEAGQLPEGIKLAAPAAESARICLDKLETFYWLRAHEISACETWAPSEAVWRGEDLVAKPCKGVGSSGVNLLKTEEALEQIRGEGHLVVQPRCQPPEVTIDAFLSQEGKKFRAVCRERLETKAGVCTKARVFESDGLASISEQVARGLDLFGASCIQVMRNASDQWCVTDANARSGGGARLSTAAGVDVLGASCAELLDRPLPATGALDRLPQDTFVVRQYDEYVVP
jgi:carbamoyl-phosphate synthase large subunit